MGRGKGNEVSGMGWKGWVRERAADTQWHFHSISLTTSSQEGAKDEGGKRGSGQWLVTSACNSLRTLQLFLPLPLLQPSLSDSPPPPPPPTPSPQLLQSVTLPQEHHPPRRTLPNLMLACHTQVCFCCAVLSLGWDGEGKGGRHPEKPHIPQCLSRTGPCGYGGWLILFLMVFINSVVVTYLPTCRHHPHLSGYSHFEVTSLLAR